MKLKRTTFYRIKLIIYFLYWHLPPKNLVTILYFLFDSVMSINSFTISLCREYDAGFLSCAIWTESWLKYFTYVHIVMAKVFWVFVPDAKNILDWTVITFYFHHTWSRFECDLPTFGAESSPWLNLCLTRFIYQIVKS